LVLLITVKNIKEFYEIPDLKGRNYTRIFQCGVFVKVTGHPFCGDGFTGGHPLALARGENIRDKMRYSNLNNNMISEL
jgi:hypothetical protein